jgi:hypothetical protein
MLPVGSTRAGSWSRKVRKIERSPPGPIAGFSEGWRIKAGRWRNAIRAFVLIPNDSIRERLAYLCSRHRLVARTEANQLRPRRGNSSSACHPGAGPPLDHACVSKMARFWVIALGLIMGDEVVHDGPLGENHSGCDRFRSRDRALAGKSPSGFRLGISSRNNQCASFYGQVAYQQGRSENHTRNPYQACGRSTCRRAASNASTTPPNPGAATACSSFIRNPSATAAHLAQELHPQ